MSLRSLFCVHKNLVNVYTFHPRRKRDGKSTNIKSIHYQIRCWCQRCTQTINNNEQRNNGKLKTISQFGLFSLVLLATYLWIYLFVRANLRRNKKLTSSIYNSTFSHLATICICIKFISIVNGAKRAFFFFLYFRFSIRWAWALGTHTHTHTTRTSTTKRLASALNVLAEQIYWFLIFDPIHQSYLGIYGICSSIICRIDSS